MQIKRAAAEHAKLAGHIVHNTICAIYPRYYPDGAVVYSPSHHEVGTKVFATEWKDDKSAAYIRRFCYL